MREILIISGKGGTGKTSLTAAFAHLAKNRIICDLDVDAPDLHLLLHPRHITSQAFQSGHTARIVQENCVHCGACASHCHFDAIDRDYSGNPIINPLKCEGCKLCVALCPEKTITFTPKECGIWHISDTRFGTMVHAQLFPAEENSGKLVALLRKQARVLAKQDDKDLILSDGPPGIGCPVISALSGVHLAVIVTEPTPSGLHDMQRVATLCEHFNVPAAVIINKWDLNARLSNEIQSTCADKNMPVITMLPHDPAFSRAIVEGRTITEHCTNGLYPILEKAWNRIVTLSEAVST